MRLVNVRHFGPTSDGSPAECRVFRLDDPAAELVAGNSACCPREAASLRQDNPGTAIESLRPIGWRPGADPKETYGPFLRNPWSLRWPLADNHWQRLQGP
jgi:hypothetical protein